MALWRERLFAAMARNARTAGDYFNIPSGRVIELGTKIEIDGNPGPALYTYLG